jgi:hypothetical protein
MAVLVDLGATSPVLDGRVHVLTPTAETVWMLLDRPVTIHGLVDRVLGQYDGPRQAILRDVTRLVDQLVALDMALLVSGDLSSHSR